MPMGASGGEAQANGAGALVPVGEVKSSLPSFKSTVVESQTRKVGLIYPPPDIRAIADKTAAFVAKNGATQISRCGGAEGIIDACRVWFAA